MVQIYGSPRSSAGRCFVMLEEAGIPYEVAPVDMMGKKEHKSESFLKLNPNGKIPCLVDEGFVLWESAAIVHYIAEKYKPELLGSGTQDRALVQQWSYWTMTEAQPPMVDILIQKFFVPEGKKDLALIARRQEQIPGVLAVLEQALTGRKFLVGNKYSMADLMAASAVNIAAGLQLDLALFPNIKAWMVEVKARPAWVKVTQLREAK